MDDLYALAQHDPIQAIPELERLMTTYPQIPTFANHLSIAYLAAGDQEKATAWSGKPIAVIPSISSLKSTMRICVFSTGRSRKFQGFLTIPLTSSSCTRIGRGFTSRNSPALPGSCVGISVP